MKLFLAFSLTILSTALFAFGPAFPTTPNLQLTPGKLCDRPTGYRYPEHIAYCERDVTYDTKEVLIKNYDQKLGYSIETMGRADFKIDHFIPLCAGGSNDTVNLWPQHKSVYEVTDPVEPLICEKMLEGKLSQSDAVKLVMKAKTDLSQVPAVMKTLNSL
ncbi:MAG: hypothetical protein ACXVLQ_16275 [Bacteriovorax sp.]